MDNITRFVVLDKSAKMPASCWGRYRRVAVVETDLPDNLVPRFIGKRARGLTRIVRTWEKLHAGATEKSVYIRALIEADALAADLNERRAA